MLSKYEEYRRHQEEQERDGVLVNERKLKNASFSQLVKTFLEALMKNSDRKNELFTNSMSNLMKDKLGVSIDLLNELISTDSEDKLAFLARGSVCAARGHPCPRQMPG